MSDDTRNAHQAWRAVQSRKGLVLLTTACAAATAVAISLAIPPVYESRVIFQVSEAGEADGMGAAARGLLAGADPWLASQVVTLQSMLIRREIVRRVPERRAEALDDAVDVSVYRKAALQARVLDTDPAIAARLANAHAEVLGEFLLQRRAMRRDASIAALTAQREQALARSQAARDELGLFLAQRRTPSLQREQDLLLVQWQQAQGELAAAGLRLGSIEQRLSATGQQLQAEFQQTPDGLQSPVPALQRLAQELAALEVDLAAARAEYDGEQGERHPKVKALTARVRERRAQLDREARGGAATGAASSGAPEQLREQLRRELLDLQRQRLAAQQEITTRRSDADRLRHQLGDGQAGRLQEQQLLLRLESAAREAETLGQRLSELATQALRRESPVLVLTEAVPASQARFPSAVWNGLLGAALGVVAGLYIALYSRQSGQARGGAASAARGAG